MHYKLNVSYRDKDEAKKYGARWNVESKYWYYEGNQLPDGLKKWYPQQQSRFDLRNDNSRFSTKTNFKNDLKKSEIVSDFMDRYYYGVGYKSYERKRDKYSQELGIDIIVENKLIDEKAQIDYVSKSLPTFALELRNTKSGKVGWYLDEFKKTTHYMFLWPHADVEIYSLEDINKIDYALVNRKTLKNYIFETTGLRNKDLDEYTTKMGKNKLNVYIKPNGNKYYSQEPFDNNHYLCFTQNKGEKPINLIIKKRVLFRISDQCGEVFKR